MSTKESLIGVAEENRARGNLREAIELIIPEADIDSQEIAKLTDEELIPLMQLWRIWAVSLTSLHKKEWNGKKAAEHLLGAKDLFERFYNNPDVAEAAGKMAKDPRGNEYQMEAEMLRDQGRWSGYKAALTGNPALLNQAIEYYNQAIEATEEESSVWGVTTMEKEIISRQDGGTINWPVFKEAYLTVVKLSPQAGGWDRMAAVSWWYFKEANRAGGQYDELKLGWDNFKKASEQLGVNWIINYPLRDILSGFKGMIRKITYPQKDQYFEAAGHK